MPPRAERVLPAPSLSRWASFHVIRPAALPGIELHEGQRVVDRGFAAHAHDACNLVLVESGGRRVVQHGEDTPVAAGELFITASGERHATVPIAGGWSFRSLYLPPELLADAGRELGVLGSVRFATRAVRRLGLASEVRRACAAFAQRGETLAHQSQLLGVLIELLLQASDARPRLARIGREPRALVRVDEVLRDAPARQISLDDLAAIARMSKFHLLRVFRAHHGMTPHAIQRHYRLGLAKLLLWQGIRPAEVALRAGFWDQSHLTNAFRAAVGVTPARFQRLRRTASPGAARRATLAPA